MSYDLARKRMVRAPDAQEDERVAARASRNESAAAPQARAVPTRAVRTVIGSAVRVLFLFNLQLIVWLWLSGGGVSSVHDLGTLLTSTGRITGLLGAYSLLIQVLLLARIPFLEWIASFDRLAVWHRINGKLCLYLIVAHVAFITAGYAMTDRITIPAEAATLLGSYPGMIAASIGTVLLILVAVTSVMIVRRRLRYETWYLVHLMAYAGIVLGWFHQIPTGNEFVTNPLAAAYWTALYVATLQLVVLFRFAQPFIRALWHGLRVAEVIQEGSDVVTLRITGRHLDWLDARAGQFFLWRFLDRRWRESHPFSLSAAPDGRSLRITVKGLGDFSTALRDIKPGTRVIAEGPFGSFTADAQTRSRVALIAGGIGITPIRALLEELSGDIVLLYRVVREDELIFREELEELARRRGIAIHYVLGDHRQPENAHLMTADHLRSLVPNIASREFFLCGPPSMMRAVIQTARRLGVPPQYIHTDQFAL